MWLRPLGGDGTGPVQVDFGAGRMRRRRRGGHNRSLGRAVGAGKRSPLSVIDATAGLGKDSFVLADLGCEVVMLERAVAAFALLRDGLHRARSSGDPWLEAVSARLSLWRVDALEWLATHPRSADVVYLDPMFPVRKKSARTKKDMWLLNSMTGPDADQDGLLPAALDAARWRVVVKRPAKAPPLRSARPITASRARPCALMCTTNLKFSPLRSAAAFRQWPGRAGSTARYPPPALPRWPGGWWC